VPTRPERLLLACASACLLLTSAVARAAIPPAIAQTIAVAEDQRRFKPDLEKLLTHADPAVRARAARAVGRLQDSTTVDALRPLLDDAKAEVRREAVFALGQIGHASARPALEGRLADRDGEVGALAIEALGKLGDKAATPKVIAELSSSVATRRAAAAMALWRLADSTALEPLLAREQDQDPETRWRVIYALEKIVAPDRIIPVVARHLDDESPWVRAYTARTLGRQKSPRATADLLRALQQREVPVVVNAIRALQFSADTTCASCATALARLLGHAHPYVRVTAAGALADRFARPSTPQTPLVVDSLSAHLKDIDPATRAAAARSLLAIRGSEAVDQVRPVLADDPSVYARTGVMSGLRTLPKEPGWLPFLRGRLGPDRPLFERMTAAEMIGARGEPGSAELLRAGLADSSVLYVASCASALAEMKDSSSVSLLAGAYAARAGDADPDARIAVRDALRDLAGRAFADSIERVHPSRNAEPATYAADFAEAPKVRGAILHTARGNIELAFDSREAPQTVKNFVKLARRGYFDGKAFHRVVPNFVIQDGDPTGTGSGGPGYTIRCEYNMLRYGPGMVGMALSGKDTGGSQWFITHSPQHHLDGRYTIFAHVVRGMDVVGNIVQGDAIGRVQILD